MEVWVKVKANSDEDKIEVKNKEIVVHVRDEAQNNRANLAVERLFFSVTHKPARIVSGLKQRRKLVRIDIDEQELYKLVC